VPAILFAVARKKKAVICTHTINLQEQLIEKDLPVLKPCCRSSSAMRCSRGGRIISAPAPAQGHGAAMNLFTSPSKASWSAFTNGRGKRGTEPLDFETEPMRRSGRTSARSAGCARRRFAGINRTLRRATAFVFSSGRGPHHVGRRVVLNHTLFFTLLGGVDEEQEGGFCSKTISSSSTKRTRWKRRGQAHRAGCFQRAGAVRLAAVVESAHGEGPALGAGPWRLGEARGGRAGQSDEFFHQVESVCEELAHHQSKKPGAGAARA